jgi:hypothetical protein
VWLTACGSLLFLFSEEALPLFNALTVLPALRVGLAAFFLYFWCVIATALFLLIHAVTSACVTF